jgi:hypothetical protein
MVCSLAWVAGLVGDMRGLLQHGTEAPCARRGRLVHASGGCGFWDRLHGVAVLEGGLCAPGVLLQTENKED